jgi:hypothetical protein
VSSLNNTKKPKKKRPFLFKLVDLLVNDMLVSRIFDRLFYNKIKKAWTDFINRLSKACRIPNGLLKKLQSFLLVAFAIAGIFCIRQGNLFEAVWKCLRNYVVLLLSLIPTCEQQHTPAIIPKDTIVAVVAPYNVSDTTVLCYFAYDSYSLPDSSENLKNLVHTLKQYPSRRITIAAYTDNKGSRRYNERLSQRRAKAVYDYLCSKGIDGDRIIWQGKGVSLKYNTDAQNRRAEFVYRNEICSQ